MNNQSFDWSNQVLTPLLTFTFLRKNTTGFFFFGVFLIARVLSRSRSPFYYSFLSKHGKDSSEETTQIHKESYFLHIFSVQLGLIRNLYGVSAVNLCPTAKSRLDIVGIVFISLCGKQILIP